MEAMWRQAPASVRDMVAALADRDLAYTTVMTTLDRLYKKGLLAREKEGQAFLYRPAMDRETYDRRLVSNVLEGLPTESREALLSGFLDFAATDDATLDILERLISERKRGEC
jgi:predicted transcriptional regulator